MTNKAIRLPAPHSAVTVRLAYVVPSHDRVHVHYRGTREQLIAAGVATARDLAPWGEVQKKGVRRCSEAGHHLAVHRQGGKVLVNFKVTQEAASRLPGMTREILEPATWLQSAATALRADNGYREQRELPRRAHLRLVVDNTRSPQGGAP